MSQANKSLDRWLSAMGTEECRGLLDAIRPFLGDDIRKLRAVKAIRGVVPWTIGDAKEFVDLVFGDDAMRDDLARRAYPPPPVDQYPPLLHKCPACGHMMAIPGPPSA